MTETTKYLTKETKKKQAHLMINNASGQLNVMSTEAKALSFVEVEVKGLKKSRRAGRYFLKEFEELEFLDKSLSNYHKLYELGFPVIPTYRRLQNEKKILMTDLTENGKYLVFSFNEIHEGTVKPNTLIKNFADVRLQLAAIVQKAATADCFIQRAAYFVRVDSSGKAHILIGDVGRDVCFEPTRELRNALVRNKYTTDQEADEFYKLLTGEVPR